MSGLVVHDAGEVRTITFDRPEKKNALTVVMRDEFCQLLESADVDPNVKAVIVTGTDPAFTSGVDFKDVDPSFNPRQRRFAVNPGRALRAMRTPVLSAVNGPCVSGGLEIALSCSFIVASERATFADTHARLNVVPAWGLTVLLPQAVGLRKARELSMTGSFVDAATALRLGLVNHVVGHDELLGFTTDLAERIAGTSAVADILAMYDEGQDLGLSAGLDLEMRNFVARTWDSKDFQTAGESTVRRNRTT